MRLHRYTVRRLGLLAIVAGALAAPATTHATIQACRVDPIVWINAAGSSGSDDNLYKLVVVASINDSAANIQMLTYTVHAPAGTSVAGITYTGGALQSKENVVFVADNSAATFTVTTNATTYGAANNGLSAAETVIHPGFSSGVATAQGAGLENQDLITSVVQP